ncbi:MAG: M48 metallopeptidase family protein [Acidimicrobiales bacterium]
MEVRVLRSPRRRKSVAARQVGDVLQVTIPAWMNSDDEQRAVDAMVRRMERKAAAGAVDIAARSAVLAALYDLPAPSSVRWVDNQQWRWGSCSPGEASLRLSTRLTGFPAWVIDYVIVHELAHLRVAGHGPDFWALVDRYPRTERARGFLLAKGGEDDE